MKICWIFNIIFLWLVRTHSATSGASETSGSYKPLPYALFMKIWKISNATNAWLWIMKMHSCKIINKNRSFYNNMFIYPTFNYIFSFHFEKIFCPFRKKNCIKKVTSTSAKTSDIVYSFIWKTHIHFKFKMQPVQ